MKLSKSSPARLKAGVALIAAGTPTVLIAIGCWEFVLVMVRIRILLFVLFCGTGWGVLAAWAWSVANRNKRWTRAVWILAGMFLALAALGSIAFMGFLTATAGIVATQPFEWLGMLGILCPGFLAGGAWLLCSAWPRRPAGRAAELSDAPS